MGPKAAFPALETRLLSHIGLCATLRSGCVWTCERRKQQTKTEKSKTKKAHENVIIRVYVWWLVGTPPVQLIVMILGPAQDIANVINRAKFFIDRFKEFGLRKGQSLGLSYRKPQWPIPLCVALLCTHVNLKELRWISMPWIYGTMIPWRLNITAVDRSDLLYVSCHSLGVLYTEC